MVVEVVVVAAVLSAAAIHLPLVRRARRLLVVAELGDVLVRDVVPLAVRLDVPLLRDLRLRHLQECGECGV